jgi:hypothetical protein
MITIFPALEIFVHVYGYDHVDQHPLINFNFNLSFTNLLRHGLGFVMELATTFVFQWIKSVHYD